jgi:hypothetical protein
MHVYGRRHFFVLDLFSKIVIIWICYALPCDVTAEAEL